LCTSSINQSSSNSSNNQAMQKSNITGRMSKCM